MGADDGRRKRIHARSRGRGQGGFTLIESIVSLALVTAVILTLAAGLLTTVRSSTSAKGTQLVDAALSAYAESFKGQTLAGGCPTPAEFEALASEPDWFSEGTNVSAFGVERSEGWDDTAATWIDCDDPAPPSSRAHRLRVQVTVDTPEGQQSSTGQVVVRQDT